MKRLTIALILVMTTAFYAAAQSVTVDFKIVGHEVNFMKLQNTVQAEVDKGYTPIGLSGYDDKLYVLYLSDNVIRSKAWQVARYKTIEELDKRIAEKISEGWFPAGYSSLKGELYALFLESDYKATYYKAKESKIDDESLKDEFAPFLRTGTIPMDFDILGDVQLYLSAQMANMPASDWKQVSFDFESETLNQQIAEEMKGRYLPWGMDITEGILRISFLKFK